MKSHYNSSITEGVIWKQLLIFFVPILLGSLFQQLYNMVDAMVVGRFVGKEALAAVDSTSSFTSLLVNFFCRRGVRHVCHRIAILWRA